MAGEEAAEDTIARLGHASGFLSSNAMRDDLSLGCECAKETLLRAAKDLVQEAGGRPMVTSKSCDGTPLTVVHNKTYTQPSGKKVKVSGRACQDFLVCNQFIRFRSGSGTDGMRTKAILSEPVSLNHGKSVHAILLASRLSWQTLRQLGHHGCAIEHYCWDRFGITALERETREWHAMQPLPQLPPHMDPDIVALTEFVCITPCALHDAHNSLKWSMRDRFADPQLLRDLYIVMESLRRSADLLSANVYQWLSTRLRATASRGPHWVEQRLTMWIALGLDPETSDILARQLQLVWDGEVMWFLSGAFSDGDLPEAVASSLMAAWRFRPFTESRWLSIGCSSRTLVAALLTGIDGLVRMIKQDKKNSLFYLRGFDRLKGPAKEFIVVASMASRVADAFQTELMHDNRVAQNIDALWVVLGEQLRSIIDLPQEAWSWLGEACGWTSDIVADQCINAAHVSLHFLWRRVLEPAEELPWSLVRGDIDGNLTELYAGECPEEPISQNLWKLMEKGFNKLQLVATVQLLGEVPWSSLPAEQQHGSLAMLHKWHPGYSAPTLISRALMLQVSKLVPSPGKQEKEAQKLVDRLQRILRAQPDRVHGRNMLIGSMIAICRGKKEENQPGYEHSMDKVAKHCMTRHMAMWAQQSLAQRAEWEARARRHSATKKHLFGIQWQVLSEELTKVESEIEKTQQKGSAMTMRSASLDEGDLEVFHRLWNQADFRSQSNLGTRRSSVGEAPNPVQVLRGPAPPKVWKRSEPTMPDWAKPLIVHRDAFMGAALVIRRHNGEVQYWKLVFAVQSPNFYLAMCQLHPIPLPSIHDLDAPLAPSDTWQTFRINFALCCSAADVHVNASDDLSILFRLKHSGGTRVTSDMPPVGLDLLVAGDDHDLGPVQDPAEVDAKSEKPDPVYEELVEVMPWLRHLDMKEGFTGWDASTTDKGPSGSSSAASGILPAIDDDEILAGLDALERERAAIKEDAIDAGGRDFVTKIRGGLSETLKSGMTVHAAQGQCTSREAEFWARLHGATTFKATFNEHTMVASKVLTRCWCHRMQYFYDLEKMAPPGSDFSYTPDVVASYMEPTELAALCADKANPKWKGWMVRIVVIRRIPRMD